MGKTTKTGRTTRTVQVTFVFEPNEIDTISRWLGEDVTGVNQLGLQSFIEWAVERAVEDLE